MNLIVQNVPVGSRIVDSLPFSSGGTSIQAAALKSDGVDGLVGYLGAMTAQRLEYVLGAGMGYMPVTFAGAYKNGAADEVAQLKALGVLPGVTVWLDLEGIDAYNTPIPDLKKLIEGWAQPIVGEGFIAGLYVGAPQPFTGEQLQALNFITRYWLGQGRCMSKPGNPTPNEPARDAYPKRGWCMRQDWHGQKNGLVWRRSGVLVDTNGVQVDHFGCLPTWMIAAP